MFTISGADSGRCGEGRKLLKMSSLSIKKLANNAPLRCVAHRFGVSFFSFNGQDFACFSEALNIAE
jgi:hypothetical protein